jgi:hypothetical protein
MPCGLACRAFCSLLAGRNPQGYVMLTEALRPEVQAARDAIQKQQDEERRGHDWVDDVTQTYDFKQEEKIKTRPTASSKPSIKFRYPWKRLVERAARKLSRAGFLLESDTLIELLAELPVGQIDGNDPVGMARDIECVRTTADRIKQILDECLGTPIESDQSMVDFLRRFVSGTPFELVRWAIRVDRLDLLSLFNLSNRQGGSVDQFRVFPASVCDHSQIYDSSVSSWAGQGSAIGEVLTSRSQQLAIEMQVWRDEVREQNSKLESDHVGAMISLVELREAFGDAIIEQIDKLRREAADLLNLIERVWNVAVGASTENPATIPVDGLYAKERCFIWGGRRFEKLTPKMVTVLAVFDEQFKAGFPIVNLQTIKSKTGIRFDGAFINQAFKQNRKGQPTIHPVADAIVTVGRGEYRLTEPQKL